MTKFWGAVLPALVLIGCQPAVEIAAVPDAATEKKKEEPAFVEGLPRDQWLTLTSAIPLSADGVVRDEKRRPYSYQLLGKSAPPFSATLVDGSPVTEEVFRGKWTIVDVWGIWCGDCRRDAPRVKTLADKADADPDIDFISLHTPPSRARANDAYGAYGSVQAYFEKEGGGYKTIVDPDASLREAFKIVWTPSYLLIGPDLTIQAFRTDLSVGSAEGIDKVIAQAKEIKLTYVPAGSSKGSP
jgi:thiol-disulfide isomerase/thioredoxin